MRQRWANLCMVTCLVQVHCMREGGIKEGGNQESSGSLWEHCLLLVRYVVDNLAGCFSGYDQHRAEQCMVRDLASCLPDLDLEPSQTLDVA